MLDLEISLRACSDRSKFTIIYFDFTKKSSDRGKCSWRWWWLCSYMVEWSREPWDDQVDSHYPAICWHWELDQGCSTDAGDKHMHCPDTEFLYKPHIHRSPAFSFHPLCTPDPQTHIHTHTKGKNENFLQNHSEKFGCDCPWLFYSGIGI